MLGSVDAQVFWELLAQLLEDSRYRPPDQLFDSVTLPKVFGEVYHILAGLPIGESIDLAEVASLRRHYLPSDSSAFMDNGAVIFGISASAEAPPSRTLRRAVPHGSSLP